MTEKKQANAKSSTFGGLIVEGEQRKKAVKPARAESGTRREAPKTAKSVTRKKVYLQVTLEDSEGLELDRFCLENRTSRTEVTRILLQLLREDNPTINKVKRAL